ncbi:hypothetical protein NP493_181g05031 [Ridgeia piscesae]|uniref:Peptidase S1 domain-containing protein n=1 Tax=Ridgeia piscesae TaxID=27915 RepID=A0AAD9P2L7_RIDPI|nr:hypothetical protein NP493_181g05031 [Ridgeia piscesae]
MSPHVTMSDLSVQAWRPLCNFLGTLFDADNWKVWKVPVAKIIVHPDYNKQDTWHNDLAVLKLEYDVPATIAHIPRIRKVALPIQGDTSFPKVGQECYMKGWGCDTNGGPKQELAREVMLPIRSNVDCGRSIRRNLPWLTRLCAGYNGTLKGLCQASRRHVVSYC